MRDLHGKRALVTGAASGIGRALSLELARHGVDLFLVDIDEERLPATAEQASNIGVRANPLVCDLSRPDEVSDCVREVLDTWGGLDILVNNAGVAYYGPTDRMTAEQWDWLLQINLLTPIQLTRELLPVLLEQDESHILNVCSIAGLVATRKTAAYHVSKFGLVGFSESLRAEYRHRGLGVTALCPGVVRTNLFDATVTDQPGKKVKPFPRWLSVSPEAVANRGVAGIRHNRGLVVVSLMARFLWLFKRLSPDLLGFVNGFRRKRRRAVNSPSRV